MKQATPVQTVDREEIRTPPAPRKGVCPFCGHVGERPAAAPPTDIVTSADGSAEAACAKCGLEDNPATRQATRVRVGPWFVLQSRNPAAPGMNFETLLSLIQKGRVTARSIVRGPTTHQLWRLAAKVKGVSREFGVCWGCAGEIVKTAKLCPHCKRLQEPPANPNVMMEGAPDTAGTALVATEGAEARATLRAVAPRDVSLRDSRGGTGGGFIPPRTRGGRRARSPMGDMELAAFRFGDGDDGDYRPRRGRRILKTFAVAAVVAVVGTAALLVLNPVWWEKSRDWASAQWAALTEKPTAPMMAGDDASPAPAAGGSAQPRMLGAADTSRNAGGNAKASPPAPRPPAVSIEGPQVAVAAPATQPTTQPQLVAPTPTPVKPADIYIGPAPAMTMEAARARAHELRFEAYTAVEHQRYAQAVRCWEEMAKLPKEAHHQDMAIKLAEARDLVRRYGPGK